MRIVLLCFVLGMGLANQYFLEKYLVGGVEEWDRNVLSGVEGNSAHITVTRYVIEFQTKNERCTSVWNHMECRSHWVKAQRGKDEQDMSKLIQFDLLKNVLDSSINIMKVMTLGSRGVDRISLTHEKGYATIVLKKKLNFASEPVR